MPDDAAGQPDAHDPARGLSYEDAIEQVEAIADRIESGDIGLEDSIKAYERGVALLKRCRQILDRAEQRITELTIDDDAPAPRETPPGGSSEDAPF